MSAATNSHRITMQREIGTKVVRWSKAETDQKIYAACRWKDASDRSLFLATLTHLTDSLKEFIIHTKELLDFDSQCRSEGSSFSLEEYLTKWKEERDLLRTAWKAYEDNLAFYLDEALALMPSGELDCSDVPSILSLAGRARGGRRPLRRRQNKKSLNPASHMRV